MTDRGHSPMWCRDRVRTYLRALIAMLLFATTLLNPCNALAQPSNDADYEVPDFVGLSATIAMLKMLDLGLKYELISDTLLCQHETLTILKQDPPHPTKINKEKTKIFLFAQKATVVPDLSSEIPQLANATPQQVSDKLKSKGFSPQISTTLKPLEGPACAVAKGYATYFMGLEPPVNSPICENGQIVVKAEKVPIDVVIQAGKCDANGLNCVCF